jgi:hypothetical protein
MESISLGTEVSDSVLVMTVLTLKMALSTVAGNLRRPGSRRGIFFGTNPLKSFDINKSLQEKREKRTHSWPGAW